MDLNDLINRNSPPLPWAEGENIPWNEPGFSARMLKEHLSQAHDAASRRFEIIDRQVEWIHANLLAGKASRILDLGCGPGLYSNRLAKLGHICMGIDYSPASIEYATTEAQQEGLNCQYTCQDIRKAEFPPKSDLVMLIYGEFNIFRPTDAKTLLEKAWRAVKPGGILLLEPHTYQMVQQIGKQPASWYSSSGGLFLDEAHLVLKENFWNEEHQTATIRYFVLHVKTCEINRYAQSFQAYTDEQYRNSITDRGFSEVTLLPSLSPVDPQDGLIALVAHK